MLGLGKSMDCVRKARIHGLRRAIHELSQINALRITYIRKLPIFVLSLMRAVVKNSKQFGKIRRLENKSERMYMYMYTYLSVIPSQTELCKGAFTSVYMLTCYFRLSGKATNLQKLECNFLKRKLAL